MDINKIEVEFLKAYNTEGFENEKEVFKHFFDELRSDPKRLSDAFEFIAKTGAIKGISKNFTFGVQYGILISYLSSSKDFKLNHIKVDEG